jgi:hypothetical protein
MKLLLFTFTFVCFFVNAQITSGLVAHFPFNGTITDESSSEIVATNNNCFFSTGINGQANYAINFDNNGDIRFGSNELKVMFPLSVSFWVSLNDLNNINILFKTDNVYDNYHGVWMNNLPSGQISLCFGGGNGVANSSNQRYYTSDLTITAGNWHHVVGIIRDYDDMDIYIDCQKSNGVYGGTGSTSVAYSLNGDSRIGGSIGSGIHPSDFYTDGKVDEFAFWDRELNTNEIEFICNQNNALSIDEVISKTERELVYIFDSLGRKTEFTYNTILIFLYDDGSTEKVYVLKPEY